jgi:hypothetical protein
MTKIKYRAYKLSLSVNLFNEDFSIASLYNDEWENDCE